MNAKYIFKRYIITTAAVVASAFLQAFAMQAFLNPVQILSSGFTGVAVLIEKIASLSGFHFSTSLPYFMGMGQFLCVSSASPDLLK